ncbi:MAG: hypothetical protein KDB03_20985, partial [Planctomycetales bacterium]|nr:hypothetical protein [Planctomycetales bacterium]
VMPHFFRNWQEENLRKMIINGVAWSAGLEVPAQGIRVDLPDLKQFLPASIEPIPRTPRS